MYVIIITVYLAGNMRYVMDAPPYAYIDMGGIQKILVGGGGFLKTFLVISVFNRGPLRPPLRSNWTPWTVQLHVEGVRSSISMETYSIF